MSTRTLLIPHVSGRIKRIALLICVFILICLGKNASAQGTFTWTGGGANDNWNTGGNWGGTAPTTPQNNLHFAGSTRTLNTNNLGSFASGFRIFLDSGAS